MELAFGLLAQAAAENKNGLIDMQGAGVGLVTVPQLPATLLTLMLVLRVLVDVSERGREHVLRVVLWGADGPMDRSWSGRFAMPQEGIGTLGPAFATIIQPADAIRIEHAGWYELRVFANDVELGLIPFGVTTPGGPDPAIHLG